MVSLKPRKTIGPLNANLRALEAGAKTRAFTPGQVIFSAGDAGDGFYVMVSGRVQISAVVSPKDSRVLATIGPGDFFGEMAVIDDAPRFATANAEVYTRTMFVGRQRLLNLLRRRPEVALSIIREFSARMRNLNQKYVEEIVQAERLAVVGRFATTIVHDFKAPLAVIGLATDLACTPGSRLAQRRELRSRCASSAVVMNFASRCRTTATGFRRRSPSRYSSRSRRSANRTAPASARPYAGGSRRTTAGESGRRACRAKAPRFPSRCPSR